MIIIKMCRTKTNISKYKECMKAQLIWHSVILFNAKCVFFSQRYFQVVALDDTGVIQMVKKYWDNAKKMII